MAGIGWASAGKALRSVDRMRGATATALLAAMLGLGACSYVPGWADPTTWFAGDDAQTTSPEVADKAADADKDARFPNLSRVPPRPVEQTGDKDKEKALNSLVADSQNARHTDQELRARPADSTTPPPAPKPPETPLPSAQPQQQVAQAPAAQRAPAQQPVTLQPPAPTAPQSAAQPVPTGNAVTDTFSQSLAQSSATTLPPNMAQAQLGSSGAAGVAGAPSYAATTPGQPGTTQLLAVIRFTNGDIRLGNDDKALIRKVAEYFKGVGGKGSLQVVGFASSRTGDMEASSHRQLNYSLSQKRAEAVAAELRRRGVDRASIRAEARADSAPVYYEAMPRAEDYNRRVEIYLAN
jgi:outer membrane protein OmpA-like peptidoglycan-associated protein